MSRRRLLVVSACFLVLVAAGCGGAGEAQRRPSISRAEFVKEANAICAKDEEKLRADFLAFSEARQNGSVSPRVEAEESINRIIAPTMTREISELQALDPPEGDEKRIEALSMAVDEGVQKARERPESLLTANSEMFGKAIALAKEFGLDACARLY
jgi:hypothetical protein